MVLGFHSSAIDKRRPRYVAAGFVERGSMEKSTHSVEVEIVIFVSSVVSSTSSLEITSARWCTCRETRLTSSSHLVCGLVKFVDCVVQPTGHHRLRCTMSCTPPTVPTKNSPKSGWDLMIGILAPNGPLWLLGDVITRKHHGKLCISGAATLIWTRWVPPGHAGVPRGVRGGIQILDTRTRPDSCPR